MLVVLTYMTWLSCHPWPSSGTTGSDDISTGVHDIYLPGVANTVYSQPGDINIGASVLTTTVSETYPAGACGQRLERPQFSLYVTEAIAFATYLINSNPEILPNVTFGFVSIGSCPSPGVTIATAMSFLPQNSHSIEETRNQSSVCISDDDPTSSQSCLRYYDVIGHVSQGYSALTMPVSSLYSVSRIPILGPLETSDEFSDKSKHPYFFRINAPDLYKIHAMLNFISSYKWSYISMVYLDGSFGQNAFDKVTLLAESYGICIATSHRLLFYTDYDAVVSDLLVHSRARAVILYMYPVEFKKLLQAVVNRNATGHFIWVASGGLGTYQGHEYEGASSDPAEGAFSFEGYNVFVPEFHAYLQKHATLTSKNPWMKEIWEYLFGCSFEKQNCENAANALEGPNHTPLTSANFFIDTVLAFGHAAHDLLADRCPNARGREARACITGELLRAYLKNTTFPGFLGPVKFDENQEVRSKITIAQFQYGSEAKKMPGERRLEFKRIGLYDVSIEKNIFYNNTPILWSHLDTLDRLVPWHEGEDSVPIEVPESVCSGPCSVGEYRIEKEVPCCWECRRCRDNEKLVEGGDTNCEACPAFTWPDPSSNFTTCVDIPPTYSTLEDTIPIVLTSLTVLTLALYTFTLIGYIFYRHERVIKASSKELSAIQLFAILAGYITILLFQMKPTQTLCSAIYFLFCLSFVLLYAPLLVKTIRIFRIFQSGKTNNRQLRLVSPESQLVLSACLVMIQVTLCAVTFALFHPGARRTQPIWSEKLVELSCDLTLPGLSSFLGYNIVLVALCSVFAFKVRKLPDNFNESQFMAMCVATTLLIWLAFIPTYFTASREYVRVFLLSTALLLNHSVALIFLFVPKIYAAAFKPQESGKVSHGDTKS